MTQILSFNETLAFIQAIGSKRTVIVQGENGVGKTALARAMARMPEYDNYIKPDPIDCTQMSDGSIWMPDIDKELGISRELPNERFGVSRRNQRGVKGSKPVIVCFDEVLKVQQFIKNMIAPIVYERRIGDYYMEDGSIVFGCTNLSTEGLGDTIQPHLRSRLCFVNMRKPTQQEWKENFAIPQGLNAAVIAYTEMFPQVFDSFLDYEPGGKFAGKNLEKDNPRIFNPRIMQDGFASPRTLHAAADIVDAMDRFSPVALQAGLEGTVGAPTAAEMASFVRFQQELTSYERVVQEPKKAPLSTNPTAQLVQVFQFITRTETREQASAVVTFVKRMKNEMQTLFCTNVANSQRIITFANAPGFNEMLAENKIFLGGVK
jgi:hypothetical protein